MKKLISVIIIILTACVFASTAEAKKKVSRRSASTASPVMFMGKSLNCSAREMRDHLVNNKGLTDVTYDMLVDTMAVDDGGGMFTYFVRGSYAGYDNCLVIITNGASKLLSLRVRVNAGRDTEDDDVYFNLLGLLDKVYGKHQFGYDEYKKNMEKYEAFLDDETIESKYLGVWKKPGCSIYIDYATDYFTQFENYDDSYVEITFANKAEMDRLQKRDQQRRISNM